MLRAGFLLVFSTLLLTAYAQRPPAKAKEKQLTPEERYQKRITTDFLDGQYIPKDLADAFVTLNEVFKPKTRAQFAQMTEEEATRKVMLHRWIIHNWGLYGGSRFSKYLYDIGISHPDDQALFVIVTYHRNLNKQPLDVKPLVERFKARQTKRMEDRMGKVIRDTLERG